MDVGRRFLDQSFRLPAPPLTADNLPDQKGRVCIVTGGYVGVGYELVNMLYQRNATVYVAGRSQAKYDAAHERLTAAHPRSEGRLEFLLLDLADLSTTKATADFFLAKEQRLDVLVNNAGVMNTPMASKSAQAYELQIGTNILGPYLLTKLLLPILEQTASTSPAGSVRVSWAGSLGIDAASPKRGVIFDGTTGAPVPDKSQSMTTYAMTKAGNYFLGSEFARRYPLDTTTGKGVLHNSFNPGNLATDLARHTHPILNFFLGFITHPSIFGGYTELYAGWSEEMGKPEHHGGYVKPWGRQSDVRKDVQAEVGGGGRNAEKFWQWCEKETKAYV